MNLTFDGTVTLPLLVSILTLAFAWFRTRRSAVDDRFRESDARFKAGSDRMDRHELRLQTIEQTVQTMPRMQDMHNLEIAMERVIGSIGKVEAVLEGNQQIMVRLETIVSRHEDHLLTGSKR